MIRKANASYVTFPIIFLYLHNLKSLLGVSRPNGFQDLV
jgi:hypothetical protein